LLLSSLPLLSPIDDPASCLTNPAFLITNSSSFHHQAATHLTEETERSDWTAPVSIVSAVGTAAIAGFAYILVLTFCIQVSENFIRQL
jgi:hypothetical protein